MPKPQPWEVISEDIVYTDRWVRVARVHVRLPNGREYVYTTLHRVPGAAVVVLNDNHHILLQQEYRHPLGKVIYQIPGGLVDEGETPLETAQRELREETGYEARSWDILGVVQDNPGLIDGVTTLFLAREVYRTGRPRPEWTEFHSADWYPLTWLRDRIEQGEVEDRVVLAAFAFLCARGDIKR